MPHNTPLITTLVAALTAALLLGVVARKLRLPPLVGYLVAGMLIGPHTPGFVGDLDLAGELSEIGIILLMFGVGLHFSLRELVAVRGVAVPGALVQMRGRHAAGLGPRAASGWTDGRASSSASACPSPAPWCCCGRCRNAASSTPMRGQDRGRLAGGGGPGDGPGAGPGAGRRGAAGWPHAGGHAGRHGRRRAGVLVSLLVTLGKVAAFVALMLLVGQPGDAGGAVHGRRAAVAGAVLARRAGGGARRRVPRPTSPSACPSRWAPSCPAWCWGSRR